MSLLKACIDDLETVISDAKRLVVVPEEEHLKNLVSACIRVIESNNMKVVTKPVRANNVKAFNELIEHYYNTLHYYDSSIIPYRDLGRDRAVAKSFIEKIQTSTGLSYNESIEKCAEIIATVFENLDDFKFENEVYASFGIFGQERFSWVTEKAIQLINNFEKREEELIALADLQAEQYLEKHKVEFGFPNLFDN